MSAMGTSTSLPACGPTSSDVYTQVHTNNACHLCYVLLFCVFCAVLCVCFCTRHFVMVPLIDLSTLYVVYSIFFFEYLFNLYSDRRELVFTRVCKEHFDMKYNVHNVSLH